VIRDRRSGVTNPPAQRLRTIESRFSPPGRRGRGGSGRFLGGSRAGLGRDVAEPTGRNGRLAGVDAVAVDLSVPRAPADLHAAGMLYGAVQPENVIAPWAAALDQVTLVRKKFPARPGGTPPLEAPAPGSPSSPRSRPASSGLGSTDDRTCIPPVWCSSRGWPVSRVSPPRSSARRSDDQLRHCLKSVSSDDASFSGALRAGVQRCRRARFPARAEPVRGCGSLRRRGRVKASSASRFRR